MTDSARLGRSLELYFIDGKPDGMLTAEVFNWTGHVLMTPRTQIVKALKRPEALRTGVYVLLGEHDDRPFAYIGEAEEVGARLKDHAGQKDWWTSALIITTAGDSLHKAHVKYLEARLVEIGREVGQVRLENGNSPARASLSEAHLANMEGFLDTLLMVLPALRVDMFLSKKRAAPTVDLTETPAAGGVTVFELVNRKHGLRATAILDGSDFVVRNGSQARLAWEGSTERKTSYFNLHRDLCEAGILQEHGSTRVFTADYAFSSTSAAGAVVNGRSTRGPTAWKVQGTTMTYAAWELAEISRGEVQP